MNIVWLQRLRETVSAHFLQPLRMSCGVPSCIPVHMSGHLIHTNFILLIVWWHFEVRHSFVIPHSYYVTNSQHNLLYLMQHVSTFTMLVVWWNSLATSAFDLLTLAEHVMRCCSRDKEKASVIPTIAGSLVVASTYFFCISVLHPTSQHTHRHYAL